MPKFKPKKALIKRFKITKSGKILRRPSGLDHYRAKKSGDQVRRGRKWVEVSQTETKTIKRLLGIRK